MSSLKIHSLYKQRKYKHKFSLADRKRILTIDLALKIGQLSTLPFHVVEQWNFIILTKLLMYFIFMQRSFVVF